MSRQRHKQHGFTLIELMIVIAIIGILAVLAMPFYNDFTARSQAAEGFTATSGLQTEIGLFATEQGRLPTNEDLKANIGSAIVNHAKGLQGKFFAQKAVTVTQGGVITVKFSNGANKDKAMTLTPSYNKDTGQLTGWVCASPEKTGIGEKRLPSSCQK
ncbi:MAG: pilin [Gammaproteobacteria bacterium]|nr:MAG: pilin [Gammaproteobacteria bacterium]